MRRRTFAQLLGASSLGLMPAGDEAEASQRAADPAQPSAPLPNQVPVNVADFMAMAKARMPKATYDYVTTGSADETTLHENVAAYKRINVLPPLLTGVSSADLSTSVLGQKISMPIILAPVAGQRTFHPQGALAAARAATAAGTIFGVSSSAGNSVEEIAKAGSGPKWFQLYLPKDRAVATKLVRRVEAAGYKALVVTVDMGEWKDSDRRNNFSLPKPMLVKHLRDIGFGQINESMKYSDIIEFNASAWDLAMDWGVFKWLRSITRMPLLIKGVLREDDARQAVALGVDGIIVSNHGGRRLDGMPATIRVLPGIVKTVRGRAEVLVDGGVRRGTDVLKALALGAKAVLIGRPYAWALAADGETGVRKVLDLLRAEFENAMISTGCARVADIKPGILWAQ